MKLALAIVISCFLLAAGVIWVSVASSPVPAQPTDVAPTTSLPPLSAFDVLARGDDIGWLNRLIQANPRLPTELDRNGQTWLWNAAKFNRHDCAALLLGSGANPNDPRDMPTPFELAITNGDPELVRLFLRFKGRSQDAMRLAATRKTADVLLVLMAADFDPKQPGSHGETALHHAAADNKLDMITVLLRAGVDVNARDGFDATPLDWAMSYGRTEATLILQEAGGRRGKTGG